MTRKLAQVLAHSRLLLRGRHLFEQNSKDWNSLSSKFDKLRAGVYLILEDYSKGLFPPTFTDQAKAYAAEVAYRTHLPGMSLERARESEMRKPFWLGRATGRYLNQFVRLTNLLTRLGLRPPARLLELGCGTGWMAEFLGIAGFDVTGTSIAPADTSDAQTRLNSIVTKGLPVRIQFAVIPMESVAETLERRGYYDAVYVFEALHHAFDWQKAIQSSFESLRPGGWLLLCNEPNRLHTFISYRVAKLANTHEIGFSRGALTRHLARVGFAPVKCLSTPFHFWFKPHWIAAQKPA